MYIPIKSFDKISKADYIKYRLELAQVDSQIESEQETEDSATKFHIKVLPNQVEAAVEELLQIQKEYPNEDYANIINPAEIARILIPIDFSDKSLEAFRYALGMAQKLPVEVKLLYVWNDELDDAVAVRHAPMIEDFKRMERNEIKRDIGRKIEKFNADVHAMLRESGAKNVLFHFTVVEGMVTKQVVNVAQDYHPQLILVAHNDNKEHHFRITQAIAADIIDRAFCPVLYIPVKARFRPFDQVNIMYATNFDENDRKSVTSLISLASPFPYTLNCVHISQNANDQESAQKMKELVASMKEKDLGDKVHGEVLVMNNLVKGLDTYIAEKNIAMISFTSPRYSIWYKMFSPDNRKKMMKGSEIPMLVFKY